MTFDFEQTEPLFLLLSLPLLAVLLYFFWQWRTNAVAALGPQAHRLVGHTNGKIFWQKNALVLGFVALVAFVLANPQWTGKSMTKRQEACDVMIAFDISKSMLANDLRPNRLVRARLFAQGLLRALAGNRVGLVFFADDAYLSMPLSVDYATLNNFLAEADPYSYSAQGTSIEPVVNIARKSFDPNGGGRALVIITDSEDHDGDASDALEDAYQNDGIVTYMVGVGTPEGGNIPQDGRGGGLLRDNNNEVVLSKMNTDMLDQLAKAGGSGVGPFLVSDLNDPATRLANEINLLKKKEIAVRNLEQRSTAYQWLLLPAMFLLAVYVFVKKQN
jgi:Ca-activated chloride channel homolog